MAKKQIEIVSDSEIKQKGEKFILTDTTKYKIMKKQPINRVELPDGKNSLECQPGLLHGTETTKIKDKGEYFEQTTVTEIEFSPAYLLRFASSVRMMRDSLNPQVKAHEYYNKELVKFEDHVKQAALIRKKIEKQMERQTQKNNKKVA